MSQLDEVAEIDMAEELSKEQRVIEMHELFSVATAEAGDDAYRRFAARLMAAKVAVIAGGLALLLGLVAPLIA